MDTISLVLALFHQGISGRNTFHRELLLQFWRKHGKLGWVFETSPSAFVRIKSPHPHLFCFTYFSLTINQFFIIFTLSIAEEAAFTGCYILSFIRELSKGFLAIKPLTKALRVSNYFWKKKLDNREGWKIGKMRLLFLYWFRGGFPLQEGEMSAQRM